MSEQNIHVRATDGQVEITIGEATVTLDPEAAALFANDLLEAVQRADNRVYMTWAETTFHAMAVAMVERAAQRKALEQQLPDEPAH